MPFINERLEANRETNHKNRAASGPVRASRFRFEPEAVMARLRANIVGQDEALTAMESMLVRVKADIGEDNRPLAVHLFLGPTGVGKTETVRLIAEAIHGHRDGLCRIDMNTLAQEHYSAALTGVGGNWDYASLNSFLTKPKAFIPGTKMNFAGFKKVGDRAAVIAYLRSLADSPATLPTVDEIAKEASGG